MKNMASKDKKASMQRQKVIRKRMNRRSLESESINSFSTYKIITYLFIFLFPPYGLYRLYSGKSEFVYQEKIVQTMVCTVYAVVLCLTLIQGMSI